MPTTRIRGAHRHPRPVAAPDPARVGGPRRWVVSAGVLVAVAGICAAGAFALEDGGGSGSQASVLATDDGSPTPWTASTLRADGSLVTGDPTAEGGPTAQVGPDSQGGAAAQAGSDGDDVASPGDGPDDVPVSGADDGAGDPATGGDGAEAAGEAAGAAAAGALAGEIVPTSPTSPTSPTPSAADVPAADREAGIATRELVQAGAGRLAVVPGHVAAPRDAPVMRVRVEVEEGIGGDGPAFAAFVMSTLNDNRSWGHDGALTFARTDGPADIRVILASPATSARLCAPAQTRGTMSCGGGDRAVLTMFRWMNGVPDYADRTDYRHYLVNHEVGHVLGHSHAYCDPGHLAPVMVQQTLGLHGCLANAWPFPILR